MSEWAGGVYSGLSEFVINFYNSLSIIMECRVSTSNICSLELNYKAAHMIAPANKPEACQVFHPCARSGLRRCRVIVSGRQVFVQIQATRMKPECN